MLKFAVKFLILVLLALCSVVIVKSAAPQIERAKYNFNSDWKLFVGDASGAEKSDFDDKDWKNITLPHAWNEDDAFRKDIAELSTGIAWYRKHFKLPANAKDKKIFLEFEGIRQAGDVYLNGKFVGSSENGVMAFGFDISNFVISGENVIAVRTDNSWTYKEKATGSAFQWNDKNFYANYGGVNKNVFLHVAEKLYQTLPLYENLGTTGTYVYATDFDIKNKSAKITAETEVKNEYPASKTFQYEIAVEDLDGKIVKTIEGGKYTLAPNEIKAISASDILKNLNFWSWGYGYLYNVYTTLKIDGVVVDTVATRTGFRKTEFADGMFKLNDRTLQLKGYAQRTTNEWVASGSREMLDSRVAEYGGEMLYINHSARIPMWAMEYSRDENLRKYWDDFSPP
ncbi:MAG: glycoside hydrolase family 2 protein, partial [Pyrinomonadaceae bacterium]